MTSRYPGKDGLGIPFGASTVKNEPSSYSTCNCLSELRRLLNDHNGISHTCPSTGTVGCTSGFGGMPRLARICLLMSSLVCIGGSVKDVLRWRLTVWEKP